MPHTKPRARTEAETVAEWIENYARVPVGPNRGQRVQLSPAQREMLFKICDNPTGDLNAAAALLDPELSAYLALVHLVGIRAIRDSDVTLDVRADVRLVWQAADSPGLRGAGHLEMIGGVICCPELNTRYPAAA